MYTVLLVYLFFVHFKRARVRPFFCFFNLASLFEFFRLATSKHVFSAYQVALHKQIQFQTVSNNFIGITYYMFSVSECVCVWAPSNSPRSAIICPRVMFRIPGVLCGLWLSVVVKVCTLLSDSRRIRVS